MLLVLYPSLLSSALYTLSNVAWDNSKTDPQKVTVSSVAVTDYKYFASVDNTTAVNVTTASIFLEVLLGRDENFHFRKGG